MATHPLQLAPVVAKIFNFIPITEQLQYAVVCRAWNEEISRNREKAREIEIKSTQHLEHYLENRNLRNHLHEIFKINNCKLDHPAIHQFIDLHGKQIKKLSLTYFLLERSQTWEWTAEMTLSLQKLFSRATALQDLHLDISRLPKTTFAQSDKTKKTRSQWAKLDKLRSVVIRSYMEQDSRIAIDFLRLMPLELRELDFQLSSVWNSEIVLQYDFPFLKLLNLDYCIIRPEQLRMLNKFPQLEVLGAIVKAPELHVNDFHCFHESDLPKLKTLKISFEKFKKVCFPRMTNLEILQIPYWSIKNSCRPDSIDFIRSEDSFQDGLDNWPKLRELSLPTSYPFTFVPDDAFKYFPSMKRLTTMIDDFGLLNVIDRMPDLEYLNVSVTGGDKALTGFSMRTTVRLCSVLERTPNPYNGRLDDFLANALQDLRRSNPGLTDISALRETKHIANLKNLKELVFCGLLTDTSAIFGISDSTSLEKIRFDSQMTSDVSLIAIADKMTNLKEVVIDATQIPDMMSSFFNIDLREEEENSAKRISDQALTYLREKVQKFKYIVNEDSDSDASESESDVDSDDYGYGYG